MTNQSTLVVICGLPISGYKTIAYTVAGQLGVHHINIDALRMLAFGLRLPVGAGIKKRTKEDIEEYAASYELITETAEIYLRYDRSLVISAPFSDTAEQDRLRMVINRHTHAKYYIFYCAIKNKGTQAIKKYIETWKADIHSLGYIETAAQYRTARTAFEKITLPYEKVLIDANNSMESRVEEIMQFISSLKSNRKISRNTVSL